MHRTDTPIEVHGDLRLATAPVNWNNNDIPGWRPVVPFPEILDRMQEAGYSATEYDSSFGCDPAILRSAVEDRGMTWCGSYQWVDFLDTEGLDAIIRSLTPTLELLDAIGCRNLLVADALRPHRVSMAGRVPADGSASLSSDDLRRLAEGAHRLAESAAAHNIAIHYHNHVGSWIEAPHEVETLLTHLDSALVDVCFDTGHYAYGGGNPADFIAHYHERIGYLHLKDVDTDAVQNARRQSLTFIEALKHHVFSPVGAGSADIPAILDVLVSSDFDGWVVIEQDTCEGDATVTARRNLDFIRAWLQRTVESQHTKRGPA
ncbi:MAG TPA: sugar phosphate isomerase/epimerase [Thermomicrobiales bacterium]|nr:sugar phosphate isomerase/epimerase [Thermomicrobiales bacterium]